MQYPKITIRLKAQQELVLEEASRALKTSKSVLLRAIIGDWLSKNEDCLYRLIDKAEGRDIEIEEDDDE